MTLVACLDGVAPGVGKSTLAGSITASLAAAGYTVELFREEEVLTHSTCAGLAEEFRRCGRVDPQTLLSAAQAYIKWLQTQKPDLAVVDALFPFIPSLMAWAQP